MFRAHPNPPRGSSALRAIALGLAISCATSGCYGPFNLTRRLHDWNNREGDDQWEDEFVFLLLTWAPVYGLTVVADAVLFNALEFWTGNNPVRPPQGSRAALPGILRFDQGGDPERLASTPDGGILVQDTQGRVIASYSANQVRRARELARAESGNP